VIQPHAAGNHTSGGDGNRFLRQDLCKMEVDRGVFENLQNLPS